MSYAKITAIGNNVTIPMNVGLVAGGSFYKINNVKELLSALGTRRSATPKQAEHGEEDSLSHFNSRFLPFEGEIHAANAGERVRMEQNLRQCVSLKRSQSFVDDDGYILLQIADEDGVAKQCYAKIIDMPEFTWIADGRISMSRFRFTMTADDPALYAQELSEITAPESFDSTTFTIEDGFLPTFQDGELPTFQDVQGQVLTVENSGTFASPPLIVIVGPTTNPVIENESTGKQIAFTRNGGLSLAANEILTINCATQTAVKTVDDVETSVKSKMSLNSEFFDIIPGANEITLFDDTPDDISSQMELSFRSSWI